MNIGIIQQANGFDRRENVSRLSRKIRSLADEGAELVVMQELHNSRYFCQSEDTSLFDLAETIPGPSTEHFGRLSQELGVVLVLSLFERRAPGLYHNTAVVLEKDGTIAGIYRKMHIPDDPGFYEKFYFTPGDTGFRPIPTSVARLGVLVCWDQWYPEAARLMAMAGAELLIYPTAIGWDPLDSEAEKQRQLDAWITVQRGHAVANGLPLIAVNRTGFEATPCTSEPKNSSLPAHNLVGTEALNETRTEPSATADISGNSVWQEEPLVPDTAFQTSSEHPKSGCNKLPLPSHTAFQPTGTPGNCESGIRFWGNSFVCGPQGELLYRASDHEEIEQLVEISPARTEQVRRWWPFFRDRRIDAYGALEKRWGEP